MGLPESARARAPVRDDEGDADEDALLASTAARRTATVRYFTRMYPHQLYRLLVVLSAEALRKVVQHEVAQAVSGPFEVKKAVPLEIEPVLPGCTVYPARQELTILGDAPVEARFQVCPHIPSGAVADARVIVRQDGKELAQIRLGMRVGKPTLAWMFGIASGAVPYALKYFKLDPETQAGEGYTGYWKLLEQAQAVPWWVWTVSLALAAVVAAWWTWPREDTFWNVQLEPAQRS
jgi:hypothetical protein